MFIASKETISKFLENSLVHKESERDKFVARTVLGYICQYLFEFTKIHQTMNPLQVPDDWAPYTGQIVTCREDLAMQVILPAYDRVMGSAIGIVPSELVEEHFWLWSVISEIFRDNKLQMSQSEEAPGAIIISGPKILRLK